MLLIFKSYTYYLEKLHLKNNSKHNLVSTDELIRIDNSINYKLNKISIQKLFMYLIDQHLSKYFKMSMYTKDT